MSEPYDYDDDSSSGDEDYDERDWTKDLNGFHERELWAPHQRSKWRFLTPYFKRVAKRCAFSEKHRDDTHAVRIGREPHDWWTDVFLEHAELDAQRGTPLAQRTARYQSVGEALRVMAVMARADYKAWLGQFIRDANYLVPKFMKLRFSEQLPRAFSFVIPPHAAPVFYHWELLHFALSPENDSDAFTRDVARVVKTAHTLVRKKNAPVNWREKLLDPIPIKLMVAPDATSALNQIRILQGVTKTVLQLQMIEAAWHQASEGSTTRARPVFRIECVDLDLRTFELDPKVLRALRKLLETGVRVATLALPCVLPMDRDEAKLRLGWGLFLSTALGHRALPSGRFAQLDSLVVPGVLNTEASMVALLSAVATTSVLKSLRIETTPSSRIHSSIQSPTWKWLAYALLGDASSNSVTTLHLDRFQMGGALLEAAKAIVRAKDPLAQLWLSSMAINSDPFLTSGPRAWVDIASNAPIAGRGFSREVAVVESTFPYTAVVVRDDPSETTLDVLIPGFGFCQVARTDTSPSTAPTEPTPRPLDTLVVGNKFTGIATKPFVSPLLTLVGHKLKALALESNDLDAANVLEAGRLCPKLESLRLRGVTLTSMDIITGLYDRNESCRLSSLELRDVKQLPIKSFEAFLKRLAVWKKTNDRLVNTLRRLRVGEGWSDTHRASTDEMFEEMLSSNRMLTHFHLVGRPQNLNVGWDIEDYGFGGEIVPDCPMPHSTRVGLLSVLRHSPAGENMSPELVQHILGFGATTWRSVYFRVDGGVVPFGIK